VLLLFLGHLKSKLGGKKKQKTKNPRTYHSSDFSEFPKSSDQFKSSFSGAGQTSCQTEFRFITLTKIRHTKINFHVTSNVLSNPYSQVYHSLEHFMMIILEEREDKERRNNPGTSNGNGHA